MFSAKTLLEAISKNGFWLNKPEAYKDQGGAEFQSRRRRDILKSVEDLKRGTNTEIGPKDLFEIASTNNATSYQYKFGLLGNWDIQCNPKARRNSDMPIAEFIIPWDDTP